MTFWYDQFYRGPGNWAVLSECCNYLHGAWWMSFDIMTSPQPFQSFVYLEYTTDIQQQYKTIWTLDKWLWHNMVGLLMAVCTTGSQTYNLICSVPDRCERFWPITQYFVVAMFCYSQSQQQPPYSSLQKYCWENHDPQPHKPSKWHHSCREPASAWKSRPSVMAEHSNCLITYWGGNTLHTLTPASIPRGLFLAAIFFLLGHKDINNQLARIIQIFALKNKKNNNLDALFLLPKYGLCASSGVFVISWMSLLFIVQILMVSGSMSGLELEGSQIVLAYLHLKAWHLGEM